MEPSLLVMQGRSRETVRFDASWKAYINTLAHDALPILALQTAPLPTLCLAIERRRSEALQHALKALSSHDATTLPLLSWQSFFVTDGSLGESFLVLTSSTTSWPPVHLRFGHFRHLPVLEAIVRTEQLAILEDGDDGMPVTLSCDTSDLQKHLAWMRLSSQTTKGSAHDR